MHRRVMAVALTAIVVLLLTGCVRFQVDLRVNTDDTVSGSVIVAVVVNGDDESARQDAAASADQIEAALLPNLRDAPGVTRAVYEDEDYFGSKYTFSGTPLDAFAGGGEDGSITLERHGDEFEFAGSIDFTPSEEEQPFDESESSNITVSVRFPGVIHEHNGQAFGNAVTWRTSYLGSVDMYARASANPGPHTWVWGVAAGIVVVLAALTIYVVRRRRSA